MRGPTPPKSNHSDAIAPSRTRQGCSLRTLLTLMALLLSALLAGGLALLRTAQLRGEAQAEAGTLGLQQAAGVMAAIDADLARFGTELQALAGLIERFDGLRRPAQAQSVLDSRQIMPAYAWAGVTDDRGRVLAALEQRLVGVDVSGRDWW